MPLPAVATRRIGIPTIGSSHRSHGRVPRLGHEFRGRSGCVRYRTYNPPRTHQDLLCRRRTPIRSGIESAGIVTSRRSRSVMISNSSQYGPHSSPMEGAAQISPENRRCPPACPRCHSSVNRIPRRFIDRLLSLAFPVHRYRCHSIICSWEGNLLYEAEAGDPSEVMSSNLPSRGPPKFHRAQPVLARQRATTRMR